MREGMHLKAGFIIDPETGEQFPFNETYALSPEDFEVSVDAISYDAPNTDFNVSIKMCREIENLFQWGWQSNKPIRKRLLMKAAVKYGSFDRYIIFGHQLFRKGTII